MNQFDKRDEREKTPKREIDPTKGGKREKKTKNEGLIWTELELISRWLVVVARDGDDWCGGGSLWRSNEGLVRREEERALGKGKNK